MLSAELRRYTNHLTLNGGSGALAVDNSLKDVKALLETISEPPLIYLGETRHKHTVESLMSLSFGSVVLTFHCFVGDDAFSIKKSSVTVDGRTRDWSWNKNLANFKFDATDEDRLALHTFLTAVVNAL